MGNCIEKQRQRELSKRALKREELVRYFLGPSVASGEAKGPVRVAGAHEPGPTSRVSTPNLASTPLELTPESEMPSSKAAASADAASSAAFTLVAAAAAAAAAAADESAASWHLTDRQREAALFAMENEGIERLHDNAELQLEQRRERQRREERLYDAASMWEDASSPRRAGTPTAFYHGGGSGATGAAASFHGGGTRHVSFGASRPPGYRK